MQSKTSAIKTKKKNCAWSRFENEDSEIHFEILGLTTLYGKMEKTKEFATEWFLLNLTVF